MRTRRLGLFSFLVAMAVMAATVTPTLAQPGAGGAQSTPHGRLQLYEATVDAEQWSVLQGMGLDIAEVEETADGVRLQLVLFANQQGSLRKLGIHLTPVRNGDGLTNPEAAALQAQSGFDVWRSYDEQGGIEDQLRAIASDPRYRGFVQLHDIGDTHQGRDILALRLTQGARGLPLGHRPAVLYQATTHAREWISTEVGMRLLRWYLDQRRANNPQVSELLRTTELWFVPVVNPDGYQYTFDEDRLWRKNLRDNDGNGVLDGSDGVDLNRNYPEHWGYDEEGASSQFSSETYRGAAPASEPETQASLALFDMADLRFAISYHSYGELLLYSQGWQVQTPSADDPVYVALTGTDDNPAVPGYDPGVGADLYTTNGEFTDWAHGTQGVLAWTPELAEGCDGCGFVFPDDEALVQAEFERNLPFALNVARSARTPDRPVSHMAGFTTADLYLDLTQTDPWKGGNPSSDLGVDISYAGGSSQPVDVLARRSAGPVTLRYRVNGGPTLTAPTAPAPAGDVFGGEDDYATHYHYLRGHIPGMAVGDSVEYWFTAGSRTSPHQSFAVVEDADADVLVLAAEDRTGMSNIPGYASTDPATPNHLDHHLDALAAAGHTADVWDVDARGRQAPDHLGVLSHYDAVVWYTGNDLVTRTAGRDPGNIDRLANDLILEARAYLNEGGRLLYTGQWAGAAETGVAGNQFYDPVAGEPCMVGEELVLDRCQLFADKDDFLQYYLGAYRYGSDGGTDPDSGEPFDVAGTLDPFTGLGWGLNGPDSADNQVHTASFLTTSSLLPPETFPQFTSRAPAVWVTGASGAFEPFDGDSYVYSGTGDISYKRLTRTIDLTGVTAADAPTLAFRFSYDSEPDWDFVFVEAHTVGLDDWTTLPDQNGHTTTSTGDSCAEGWFDLHPWLARYQGEDCSGANPDTGGTWHASSGRSDGWEEWTVDLSPYAGNQAEVAIAYASDWSIQGLGAFIDHVEVSTEPVIESFEQGPGAWVVPGSPPGSDSNPNDWVVRDRVGFEEGAVTRTASTLYFGFGLEGIEDAASRSEVMGGAMQHLLGP